MKVHGTIFVKLKIRLVPTNLFSLQLKIAPTRGMIFKMKLTMIG